MAAYLMVIGDREALGWILTAKRMAFPNERRQEVRSLKVGDDLFIYTTRGAFKRPTRDRGRIIGLANVTSAVHELDHPVSFGGREYRVGCDLVVGPLARFGEGIELAPLVSLLQTFDDSGPAWPTRLRRPLLQLTDADADFIKGRIRHLPTNSDHAVASAVFYTQWYDERPLPTQAPQS
jgi:hypothetical protein